MLIKVYSLGTQNITNMDCVILAKINQPIIDSERGLF